jgi:penicillin-binding protein 1A
MRKYANFIVKSVAVLLLGSAVALVAVIGLFFWRYEYEIGLPDPGKLAMVLAADPICSSGDGERSFVPLDATPPVVRKAFLASEEPDFYSRSAINPYTEIAEAALFGREPHHAMISNAVARCLLTSLNRDWSGRTFDWQISNIVLTGRVERDLPKDRIFEIYLNETWFGRRSHGAVAAAKAYFGKSLSDLTLDEAAYVAALPRAPYYGGRNK